jgi:hypothetical protein
MELLDLSNDDLLCILDHVDTKTMLQMMLVCKRLESLIGYFPQCYKKFTLRVTDELIEDPASKMIRRGFGTVVMENFDTETDDLEDVLKLFQIISPKMQHFEIRHTHVCDSTILKLLRNAGNLKTLELDSLSIPRSDIFLCLVGGGKLRVPIENFDAIADLMPTSIREFSFKGDGIVEPLVFQHIFKKQKKLRHLKFIAMTGMDDFEFSKQNSHIETMTFGSVNLFKKEAADKFAKFMKMQKSLRELKLHVVGLSQKDLAEILSLKTLKFLLYRDESFTDWNFQNLSIENVVFEAISFKVDHRKLLRPFPNITRLTLNYDIRENLRMVMEKKDVDLTFLNSLNLEHLSLGIATNQMLDQLDLKQLHGFKTFYHFDMRFDENDDEISELEEAFVNFLKRHQGLEVFHQDQSLSPDYLKAVIENLPKLKELKFRTWVESEEQYDDAIKVFKLAYGKIENFSSAVYFFRDENQGKDVMQRLVPDVPFTIEKKEYDRNMIYFQILKETSEEKIASSVDPMLIEFLPGTAGLSTQNGTFEFSN